MKRLMLLFALIPLLAIAYVHPVGADTTYRPMSHAQWTKILADLRAHGTMERLPNSLTTTLGITRKGERGLSSRQLEELYDVSLSPLYFSIATLPNGRYLLSDADGNHEHTPKIMHVYYVSRTLALLSAVAGTGFRGGAEVPSISIIPRKGAQRGLDADLKLLAGIADKL